MGWPESCWNSTKDNPWAVPDTMAGIEKQILDNLITAVILFDQHLKISYLNPAAEVMFATSARNVLGQSASRLLQCPDKRLNQHLGSAAATDLPFTERGIELLLPDGRVITVDCTLIPYQPEEGESGVLVEVQQMDYQLRVNREEQLISQQAATSDLIRGLAHEIKNPLGGLRGAAQLLEADLADESLKEYTQVIISEADRLQGLVDRMLGPKQLPVRADLNIHHVLERVCSIINVETGNNELIKRDYDPSIPDIRGDADQLLQAVLNIMQNAIQAVGTRGKILLRTRIQRQFTLANRRYRHVLQIDIVDNGPGVPEDLAAKLFYPMVTGRPEGTGLGLSIAQTLISHHGGLIEYTSKPGNTIFTIYLPLGNK